MTIECYHCSLLSPAGTCCTWIASGLLHEPDTCNTPGAVPDAVTPPRPQRLAKRPSTLSQIIVYGTRAGLISDTRASLMSVLRTNITIVKINVLVELSSEIS
jgi:hypothetical protein